MLTSIGSDDESPEVRVLDPYSSVSNKIIETYCGTGGVSCTVSIAPRT